MKAYQDFFIDLYDMIMKFLIVIFNVVVDLAVQFRYISLLLVLFLLLRMFSSIYRNSKLKQKSNYKPKIIEKDLDLDLYCERQTKEILETITGHKKILNSLFLDGQERIDLLMVHETGIYIFETKDYIGNIYGEENKKKWIYEDKEKNKTKFLNPIGQNYENIKAIKNILFNSSDFAYKSYVVFNEKTQLKNIEYDHSKNRVINRIRLFGSLSVDIEVSPKIFTTEQVDYINSVLEKYVRYNDYK